MLDFLKGLGVAMITPFTETGAVDYAALEKLTNHLIDGGVDYLVVLGTTGETVTLTKEEKKSVLDKINEVNNGRLPIVLGIGGNNTADVIAWFDEFDLSGISAILSVSPAYNKPSQEGIYQHYKAISEKSPLPIILYNVPGRTSSEISVETTISLAKDFANIVAMKDATGHVSQCMDIVKEKIDGFYVVSGDDALTLPMMAVGAVGVISVIANAYPKEMASLVKSALNNDYTSASVEHFKVLNATQSIFIDGNPGGIKCLLSHLGIGKNSLRLPLVPVNAKVEAQIKASMLL